ncbi:MAG: sugar transferase [Candidatus Omnitrophica bacterium]|nr:sugar transferase [Candidatus Omnitrophota bacterium]MCB9748165.1 sugar transferase [Candidatus Omnitrophota bacterium]
MKINYRILTIRILYTLIDLICIYFSIYLACLLRPTTMPFDPTLFNIFVDPRNPFRSIFVLWFITTILFMNKSVLYQTRREVIEGFEISILLKSIFFSALVIIVAIYGLKLYGFPRTVLLIGTIFMMLSLSIWRVLKRMFVEYIVAKGYNNFNALIVGAGKVGLTLAQEIEKRPGLGIKVIGYLDDYKQSDLKKDEVNILGKTADFKEIARREFINKLFITVYPDNRVFVNLLEEAKEMGIAVRVVPQGFEMMSSDFIKFNIGIIPILEYSDVVNFRKQAGKRLFDFIISSFALILLLPFFIIIALIIKIDSRGPIFYLSRRYGRGGQEFYMIKFRSMAKNAEIALQKYKEQNEVDGPIFKMKQDPRITRVGRFIRKYSIDELPQVFNVFLGHMSLVGPRPLPIDQIRKEDLRQLKRLEVRPGMTGLWQIRGRSDVSFKRLVRWDMWYINNWSFWLDLNILYQTVPVVIKAKGAY